jgi:hypothetical protein
MNRFIYYKLYVNIINPPVTNNSKSNISFKTIGTASATILLTISEAVPFIDDIKSNGIIHGVIKYFDKNNEK